MKDFSSLLTIKLYRMAIFFIILFMISGVVVSYIDTSYIGWGIYLHLFLVILVSILLIIYPKRETTGMKSVIIISSIIYFYTLFILYPQTSSTILLLSIIPGAVILLFQPALFYISLIVNCLLLAFIFVYIALVDKGAVYQYLYLDLTGNIINIFAVQVILFLIFYFSHTRIKKQQLYYEQVQQAERLKTTGQLAAAVAHEIRNPITVVKGFLQFYTEDQSLGDKKKEHFSLMLDELNVAEMVISDFLSIAKPKSEIESNNVNVKDAIHSVTDLIQSYALLNNISIRLDLQSDSFISISLMEFKQLMINLLKNAVEASAPDSFILITVVEKGKNLEINVIDSGGGMTEEELATIGTAFYSLKSKGTGLGLMICFNIVQKYHGSLLFNSQKGIGTKATILFPSNQGE